MTQPDLTDLTRDLKDCLLAVAVDTSGSQPCWCFLPVQTGQRHGATCQRIRQTLLRLAPVSELPAVGGE